MFLKILYPSVVLRNVIKYLCTWTSKSQLWVFDIFWPHNSKFNVHNIVPGSFPVCLFQKTFTLLVLKANITVVHGKLDACIIQFVCCIICFFFSLSFFFLLFFLSPCNNVCGRSEEFSCHLNKKKSCSSLCC